MSRIYAMSIRARATLNRSAHRYFDIGVLRPHQRSTIRRVYRRLRNSGLDKYQARYQIIDMLGMMPMVCERYPDGTVTMRMVSMSAPIGPQPEDWL